MKGTKRSEVWDNGLYVSGHLLDIPIDFLIDSGSTCTLLSDRIFNQIPTQSSPQLSSTSRTFLNVNNERLKVYGQAQVTIKLHDIPFKVNIIIVDIVPDAIIGQYFLLENVKKLDFSNLILLTRKGVIQCWIGGESKTVCSVKPACSITLPPKSRMWLPVNIHGSERLSTLGLVEPHIELLHTKNVFFSAGVLDLKDNTRVIDIMNVGERPVNIYPNTNLGTCQSFYEEASLERCAMINSERSSHESEPSVPEHLDELFKRSMIHLDDEQRMRLMTLLLKFQDVFSKSSDDIGQTDIVKHRINTGTAVPIRQPPRRLPFGKREIEKQEIQRMLDKGVIEPSASPWSSCIVLVKKKDGSTRFCVDYRKLNEVTIRDAYPLPRVDSCLDSLSGAKWFSSLDLNSGFWQIAMADQDKEKTAFSTSQGLYHFTVMPFGLANSPSTFERLMENVLRGLQWETCLIYMDDIIVPGSSFDEEIDRLAVVFTRLQNANLKLKPSKCALFQTCVNFLGHVVSQEGIQTDPQKNTAVKDWPTPKSSLQVKSFLGLASYYRGFIEGFAAIARPLHRICEKGSKFTWSEEQDAAFCKLKEALTSPPILAYPVHGERFILDTDASNTAVGAVLSQVQEGKEKVITYMSKSLSKPEESYCVTRKELLAVVVALKKFHPYLYGQDVLLRTDNSAVNWMRNLKAPTGQTARWLQQLGTYNLEVIHMPGKKNANADALSRNPCKSCLRQMENDIQQQEDAEPSEDSNQEYVCCMTNPAEDGNGEQWTTAEIRRAQLQDGTIEPFLTAKEADRPRPQWEEVSSSNSETKTLWRQWDRLVVQDGLLCRRWHDKKTATERSQIVVPASRRDYVLKYHHDIPSSGHLGDEKTLQRLKLKFY